MIIGKEVNLLKFPAQTQKEGEIETCVNSTKVAQEISQFANSLTANNRHSGKVSRVNASEALVWVLRLNLLHFLEEPRS